MAAGQCRARSRASNPVTSGLGSVGGEIRRRFGVLPGSGPIDPPRKFWDIVGSPQKGPAQTD